ncbi:hypothetical protein SAMN04488024_107182 [Pedobacter soli]|uniref:Uncharacterized protein n=1 Tax=Pedobacter soli TaxID=390242 RepID=A0A1G6WZL4_9SPHI|nr:hypothetical protein SAMN04488024_107182 [Pedobacter soli]
MIMKDNILFPCHGQARGLAKAGYSAVNCREKSKKGQSDG